MLEILPGYYSNAMKAQITSIISFDQHNTRSCCALSFSGGGVATIYCVELSGTMDRYTLCLQLFSTPTILGDIRKRSGEFGLITSVSMRMT